MSAPSDKFEQKINVGQAAIIVIPSILTILVFILLAYLTVIVSDFNRDQEQNACRGLVSQEIQETFRKDLSRLIILSGQEADGAEEREVQQQLLVAMENRPNYVTEVKNRCGENLGAVTTTTSTLTTPATLETSSTTTTLQLSVPEE